jgi:hypothetical protein
MIDLDIFILRLGTDKTIKGSASQLRGFFATKFNEYILLHQHNADKFVYRYPLIQYKFINNIPTVIGLNEGADVLKEIYDESDTIRLGDNVFEVNEREIIIKKGKFGLTPEFHSYRFITPWIGLNQNNYKQFYALRDSEERTDFLRRILTGNILSMSKTLGYTVPDQIKCDLSVFPGKASVKNVNHMGFKGKFHVNFVIPEWLGVGKSVSRGFGTIEEMKKDDK